jgi:ATP-binding cassette subfamily B protein
MLNSPCISVVKTNARIAQSKVSIDRVFSVIDEEIDIKIDNDGYKISVKKIKFKDVSKYDIYKGYYEVKNLIYKELEIVKYQIEEYIRSIECDIYKMIVEVNK